MGHIVALIGAIVRHTGQAKTLILVLAKYLSAEHTREIVSTLQTALEKVDPQDAPAAAAVVSTVETVAAEVVQQLEPANPKGWKPPKV